ncbi:glycosyltransferase family 4 protein [Microbacterium lacticum]|uniref:glycosyltransferase family 4 protein n=1 Tax=Microbacterium lacticum TaxID=33885 RepID=UPI001F59F545|nr:glycosyltransferase family 4 protein [Microbacterium lacticum]
MMRILFLTSTFEPLTGGAETYGLLLTSALADIGHEVTIVTDGSWLPDLPLDTAERGCRVLRLRAFAEEVGRRDKVVWRQLQYALLNELGPLLDGERFDVVHANSHETLHLALPIAESMGAALVASLHEQNPDAEAFGVGRCRAAYAMLPVDMHIAASRFYEHRAKQYGTPEARLRRIYHGVDPEARVLGKAEARAQLGLPSDGLVVTCAGRIYTRKGQVHLARAFEQIRTRHPEAHLLLAGRVSDFAYAEEVFHLLERSYAAGAVTHQETLTFADMPEVFAATDVAVQPSLEEGLGLAAIEAMQHGVPVVASDVIGLNEVIEDGVDGLLVPAEDPDALAAAVLRIADDPALGASLAAAARNTVATRFSVDVMRAATLAAYETAVRNRLAR